MWAHIMKLTSGLFSRFYITVMIPFQSTHIPTDKLTTDMDELGRELSEKMKEYYSIEETEHLQRISKVYRVADKDKTYIIRYSFNVDVLLKIYFFEGDYESDDIIKQIGDTRKDAIKASNELIFQEKTKELAERSAYIALFAENPDESIRIKKFVDDHQNEILHILLLEETAWVLNIETLVRTGLLRNHSFYADSCVFISDYIFVQITDKQTPLIDRMMWSVCSILNESAYRHLLRSLFLRLRYNISEKKAPISLLKIKIDVLKSLYEFSLTQDFVYVGALHLRSEIRKLWKIKKLEDDVQEAINQLGSLVVEREALVSRTMIMILTVASAIGSVIAVVEFLTGGFFAALIVLLSVVLLIALLFVMVPWILRKFSLKELFE